MRSVAARWSGADHRVHRVVTGERLSGEWTPDLRFVVLANDETELSKASRLNARGLSNVGWIVGSELEEGDVVIPDKNGASARILFRESDVHHSLFVTNRCNSYCLMCSQPPTARDDSWLIEQVADTVRHIRVSPTALGITGGEPLLLGADLRRIIDMIAACHAATTIEVLTNGRLLSDPGVVSAVIDGIGRQVRWLVPLYGHADFLHDFVVQRPGAFDETLAGLLELQHHRQPVQLRIVLIEPVLGYLPELCSFIGRNLPFVEEVALMACEPIGFALANRDICDADLATWSDTLRIASEVLNNYGMPYVFMNTPLCALPRPLWPAARQSISDWKRVFATECEQCVVRDRCSGLFAWHEGNWRPTKIKAVTEATA